jgi:hypothetical protein
MIPLMGGLGNQLFQLQAALSLCDGEIELLGEIGKPRNTEGSPDICLGILPTRVSYHPLKKNLFIQKVYSYTLRNSLSSKSKLLQNLVRYIASTLFSLYFRSPVRVVTASNLGFCNLKKIRGSTLLIGYFQSYRWLTREMDHFLPSWHSSISEELEREAQMKSVCIMHIRLTDYISEKSFGILAAKYFEVALRMVQEQIQVDEVWLFSDDHTEARKLLPSHLLKSVRFIDDSTLTPVQVLKLMSLGNAYVISNSTFSWWAANFSKSKYVIAPDPWFTNMEGPRDLLPPDWIRLNRNEI